MSWIKTLQCFTYNAYIGCNFAASSGRNGKVNPLKKQRKHAMTIKVFSEIEEKERVNKK